MSAFEDAWDRERLPSAYSVAVHHVSKLRREAGVLRERGLPGDRFRSARLFWYARNNQRLADSYARRAAELGLRVGGEQLCLPL